MNSGKILDILDQSKGFDTALLTTFNFEVDFFERAVLSRLLKNETKRVSIFVDSKELSKAVANVDSYSFGRKYAVNPVKVDGSFHPKMILLLGEKKARLIVGSANLKTSGFFINNEVFNYIDYDEKHTEFRNVIFDAISFFVELNDDTKHTYQLDKNLKEALQGRPYYRRDNNNDLVHLVHNLNTPVLDQVITQIDEPVEKIQIAVPYFDNDLSALGMIRKAFPEAAISLYIQQEKSKFSEEVFKDEPCADAINVFDKVVYSVDKGVNKANSRFYHGKVFVFKTDTASYVLYGSSNCTQSALLRTIDTGNVESNLLVKAERDENDSFFQGFIEAEKPGLCTKLMEFEAAPAARLVFMYGAVNKKALLHINCRNVPDELEFFFGEVLLEWSQENGHLIVELESYEQTIFDVVAKYEGIVQTIHCWLNDEQEIELFRTTDVEKRVLVDREGFAAGDKFREEYQILFRSEELYLEDDEEMERVNRVRANPSDGVGNDADTPSEEDEIVYVELEDQDIASANRYKTIEMIRGRIRSRYMHGLRLPSSRIERPTDHSVNNNNEKACDNEQSELHSRIITADKQFERDIKRAARCYLSDKVIGRESYEKYFGLIAGLFEAIKRVRQRDDLEETILPDSYVIPVQSELLIHLIKKYKDDASADDLILLVLERILDNQNRIDTCPEENEIVKLKAANNQLFRILDKKFLLRSRYEEYLVRLAVNNSQEEKAQLLENTKQSIEKMYGYKTLEQITGHLKEKYGPDSSIKISNRKATIEIYTDNPFSLYNPDQEVINEVLKYSMKAQQLSDVIMVIIGTGKKSIRKIKHKIDVSYHKLTTTITRDSGKIEIEKPRHYSL